MQSLAPAFLAALAIGGVGSAHAAYSTYFGEDGNKSNSVPLATTPNASSAEAAFLATVIKLGTETFETQVAGAKAPLKLDFLGGLTATLLGGDGFVGKVVPGETDGNGRYSIPSASTSQFWDVSAGPAGNFTVTFDRAVAGFGFYGVDIGDFGGQLQLQLLDSDNKSVDLLTVPNTIGAGGSTDGSVLYFGFVAQQPSEYFKSVQFLTSTAVPDGFAFDNFTVVAPNSGPVPVPEPGALALLVAGLVALGSSRRLTA